MKKNQQYVTFRENGDIEEIQNTINTKETSLTAWMKYNRNNIDGLNILYPDFPIKYVYNQKRRMEKKKK